MPLELRDRIKSVRLMAAVMAVCGAATVIGLPWAVLYAVLYARLKSNKLPGRGLIDTSVFATVLIIWCIAPIFLLIGLWKVSNRIRELKLNKARALRAARRWEKYKFFRRFSLPTGMFTILVLMILAALPVSHTTSRVTDLPYKTSYTKTSSLELGQRKVSRGGVNLGLSCG